MLRKDLGHSRVISSLDGLMQRLIGKYLQDSSGVIIQGDIDSSSVILHSARIKHLLRTFWGFAPFIKEQV